MTGPGSGRQLALVTGVSGFVGAAVARALCSRGVAVRALVRDGSSRSHLDGLPLAFVGGDLRDAASLHRAMDGVSALFHVAADYRLWAKDPNEILASNVEGTRNVMEAALAAGVARIVYTSSVATLSLDGVGAEGADERRPLAADKAVGVYKRSKVLAERVVDDLVRTRGLPAVIVNPSTPIGPGDVKPTPTGRIIIEAAAGRMPAFVDTGLNLVHVDDVAQGHLLAFDRGVVGERYILGGENVMLGAMLADIASLVGRRAPTVELPRALVYPIAWGAELAARFTGKPPFATVDGLKMARYRMFFTAEKARRELGFKARPHGEGLADAVAWFRAAGYLT